MAGVWRSRNQASKYINPTQVATGGANGLSLTAVPDASSYPGVYNWKSGGIFSNFALPITGWLVQWRVLLPDMTTGAWPMLWFMGLNGDSEYDLYSGGLNGPGGPNDCLTSQLFLGGNVQNQYNTGVNLASGWHIFAVEYKPGVSLKSWVDGVLMDNITTGLPLFPPSYSMLFTLGMATLASSPWHVTQSASTPGSVVAYCNDVQAYNPA
jgi:hypothetical protein